MYRIVIDTNIYISAIFWGGKPRYIIDLGRDNKIQIFSSDEIEKELSKILKDKFRLDYKDEEQILVDFSTFTNRIRISKHIHVVEDDSDDNKFIECAVECNANYIISGDRHLLNMKEYKGIEIITASGFLKKFKEQ